MAPAFLVSFSMHTTTSTTDTYAHKNKYAILSGPFPSPIGYVPRRGYATHEGRQVHFRDTGKGSPLILCHQSPATSREFSSVYEYLHNAGFRAIGVDTPGFGESDPIPFVPTIEDWAPAVIAVLDHLQIEKADILGHLTGSMVATEASLRFPNRFQKLIMNSPFVLETEEERQTWLKIPHKEISFEYQADGSHLLPRFTARSAQTLHPRDITRQTVEQFQGYAPFWIGSVPLFGHNVFRICNIDPPELAVSSGISLFSISPCDCPRRHHAGVIYNNLDSIKRVQHPTLILTNTGCIIHGHAHRARRLRPDFAYAELAGGTSSVLDQLPQQWAAAVIEFLMS